jgi:predicted transcriptional regulator
MDLATYLKRKKLTRAEFSAQADVRLNTLGRYIRGERYPRKSHMARIIKATKGAVTPNDFMGVAG